MRQPHPTLANTFSKGLITETTELSSPENSVSEAFNCVFSPIGFTQRRKGFEYEDGYVLNNIVTAEVGEAFTEYVWNAVGGDGNISFLAQQQGAIIRFINMSTSTTLSANYKSFFVDLNDHLPDGTSLNPGTHPCQYASGRGTLVIVNRSSKPIYVVYDAIADDITVSEVIIQARDFTGLTDDLALTERATDSVAGLKTDHPSHYYNLLNQGWGEVGGAALTAWDTARADMPSNADYVALYRSSPTAIFDNNRVLHQDPLNTPAAKGHFILDVTNTDRTQAMADDGFSLTLTNPATLIAQGTGTLFYSNFGANPSLVIDGNASVAFGPTINYFADVTGYVGKNYTTSPKQIDSCIVYGSTDHGFYRNTGGSEAVSITYTLMAKQTLPASDTDGTSLGTVTFTNNSNESGGRTITSSDKATFWNYVWVYQNQIKSATTEGIITELEFYSPGSVSSGVVDNIVTVERPTTVCFFAGRLFYAGLNALSLNNTIFFTQILQKEDQYGKCYQVNDPTNENIFNLLPSDGGTIVIPEMGSVRKLFAYQNALLILASNGVWLVTGGSSGGFGGGFQANDYFVKKLSSIGTSSPLSVVDRRGVPLWWAEDGIYTIQYDPNFNSFNVLNLTFKTIKSFYLAIPSFNRQFVKGAYDPEFDVIYWMYHDDEYESVDLYYVYNSILTLNGVTQAWSPWNVGRSVIEVGIESHRPLIRGIVAVRDAAGNELYSIKYITTHEDSGGLEQLTFSEVKSTTYYDWYTHFISTTQAPLDYLSYFTTAYKVESMGERYVQMNYVWVFLENITDSSCFVQGLFDFTNSGNSGKWSTPQQTYNSLINTNRVLNFRRLKIRGKGRGLQLKFYSEAGKPFQIQGWALYNTANAQP